ncbi:uncharacterized protein TNCT_342541 [Trichonephila clavata]|uniref:Uncharacterized protein n=1 Tax=Trichonephila clavata TaxID=2740835 RepID=A0A8X6KR92_TRICU|nr:uncharacterized protein TNCT_342541 [Trichonephila clavata]
MQGKDEKKNRILFPFHNCSRRVIRPVMEDDEEKHDSELLRQIHPLLIAFLFTGLDFRQQRPYQRTPNSACRETVIKISCALIHIISWVFALLFIWGAFANEDSLPRKQDIINRLMEILIIFLRSVLYRQRKVVVNTLNLLSKAYDKIKCKSKYLSREIILILLIVYPGTYILMYVLVFISFSDKNKLYFENFVRRNYGNVVPLTLTLHAYYVLGVIDCILFSINSFTMCLFVILVLVVFTRLNLILQHYFKSVNSPGATFEVLQKRFMSVMNAVKKVDECLCFPMFVILGIHILFLFYILSFFYWPASWLKNLSVAIDVFFYMMFVLYVLQYCAMTTSAAKIHEAVQNIKIEVAKMSSRPSQLTAVEQLLLIAEVNSHSNICLTVWGFMNITKSFVFSSFGALLTFGILLRDL